MRSWEWKKSLSYDNDNNYYLLSIIAKVNSSKCKTFLNQIQKNNTENYSIIAIKPMRAKNLLKDSMLSLTL